jgi:FAD/FMN-containing dehydrogenase
MRRRDFVIGSLAAPWIAACTAPGGNAADWSRLQGGLDGELLLPDQAAFEHARKLYQTRFDHIYPAAVARCRTAQDVRACVDFARRSAIPMHVRSGGHHYAGWSTGPGLVIDVSPMNQVRVEAGTAIATIGAGAQLIDVYDHLAAHGRALPGGSCPTVGIAGLVLGGGISMLGRAYGMTCDNLLQADIVTAAGEIIACDAQHHPDLFWACRGGGGGNFGIATSFRFRTHPLKRISTMRLDWDWAAAPRVMNAWQHWAPQAPDELWANCRLRSNASGPSVGVTIVYLGTEADLEPLLSGLIAPIGTPPRRVVEHQDGLHAMLSLAGCPKVTVPECHLSLTSPQGTLGRGTYRAKSSFFDRPLTDEAIGTLLRTIEGAAAVPGLSGGGALLDAFGGAIARVSPGDTAFVHRTALFSCQYLVNWPQDAEAATEARCSAWLRDLHAEMLGHSSGGAYINYVDPELQGWQRAYYGANYDRLVRVKATYDPDGLFQMPQGVVAAGQA